MSYINSKIVCRKTALGLDFNKRFVDITFWKITLDSKKSVSLTIKINMDFETIFLAQIVTTQQKYFHC